jgi:hypothetical protein
VDDATRLSIAKTLIHESMHAFINLKTGIYEMNINLTIKLNEYFVKYNYDNNLTQHNFMSQFVDALAYSLSAYDIHRQDIGYYKKLSWGGLEYSDTYKAKTQPEKTEIQKIINNERYAKKDATSKKCN